MIRTIISVPEELILKVGLVGVNQIALQYNIYQASSRVNSNRFTN